MKNYKNALKERRQTLQEIVDNINRAREILGVDGTLKLEFTIPESVVTASGALISSGGLGYYIYAGGKTGFSAAGLTSALKSLGRFLGGMKGGIILVAAIPLAVSLGCSHLAKNVNNKQLHEETERILCEVYKTINMIEKEAEILRLEGSKINELMEIKNYLTEAAIMLSFFTESEHYGHDETFNSEESPVLT